MLGVHFKKRQFTLGKANKKGSEISLVDEKLPRACQLPPCRKRNQLWEDPAAFFQDCQHIFQHCKTTELVRETIPVVSQYKVNISRLEEGFCDFSCLGYLHSEASSYCPLIFSSWRQVQLHTKLGKKVDY